MPVGQIAAQGSDGHAMLRSQFPGLLQAHRTDVLGDHLVAEAGQVHGVAPFTLGQAERPARDQRGCLFR